MYQHRILINRNYQWLFIVIITYLVAGCASPRKAIQSPFTTALEIRSTAFESKNFQEGNRALQALVKENPGNIEVRIIDAVIYLDEYSQHTNNNSAQNVNKDPLLDILMNKILVLDKSLVGNTNVQTWIEPMLYNTVATALLLDAKNKLKAGEDQEQTYFAIIYGRCAAAADISQQVLQRINSLLPDSSSAGLLRAQKNALDNLVSAKSGQLEALTELFGASNEVANAEKNELINEIYQLLTAPSFDSPTSGSSALGNLDPFKYLQLSDAETLMAANQQKILCSSTASAGTNGTNADLDAGWQEVRNFYKQSLAHGILGYRLTNQKLDGINLKSQAWLDSYEQTCPN